LNVACFLKYISRSLTVIYSFPLMLIDFIGKKLILN